MRTQSTSEGRDHAQALTAALAPKAMVLRDGAIVTIDAVNLVPGDVILIRLGNVVPADVKLLPEEGGEEGEQEAPMQVRGRVRSLARRRNHTGHSCAANVQVCMPVS